MKDEKLKVKKTYLGTALGVLSLNNFPAAVMAPMNLQEAVPNN